MSLFREVRREPDTDLPSGDGGISRRAILTRSATGVGIALTGSYSGLFGAGPSPAQAKGGAGGSAMPGAGDVGYGALVDDPAGLLSLPAGFSYKVVAQSGVTRLETGEPTPSDPDGTASFVRHGGNGSVLVNNHEISGSEPYRVPAIGGDWGGLVVDQMGVQAPPELIGIHTNQPGAVPPDVNEAVQSGGPAPPGLSDEERDRYENLKDFFATDVAYALEMGTRPQTLYGIADSPVGLAAWLLDHDSVSLALIARVFEGQSEGLTRDDILDNITHYWLTNTGISAGRIYWENKLGFFDAKGVDIPVAVSVFPDEIDAVPRSWAERAYPNLIHYNEVDKGGHFAAWEQPELFVSEVRAGLRSLR